MKRAKIFAAAIYVMLVIGTVAFVHFPDLQADEAEAKISAQQARETALRAIPGTLKDSNLETEHGRLVYSFEIVPSGERGSSFEHEPLKRSGIVEVNVSAMDGSIVNVHREHASSRRTSPGKGEFRRVNNVRKAEQCQNVSSESASHADEL
jgi:Peptidase propeptide and YPEB domain